MEEFEHFVHARSHVLLRTAFLLTGDGHLAEDLLQDALARVAQHWGAVARDGNPEAYARRVLHHRAVDTWRARRRRPALVGAPLPEPAERGDLFADSDRRLLLQAALARLTPSSAPCSCSASTRTARKRRPAAVLGCTVSTVKTSTRGALERLRVTAPELLDLIDNKVVTR